MPSSWDVLFVSNDGPIPVAAIHLHKASMFVEVVRAGSFVEASRKLGVAKSTVSDNVRALEEALGARLLERSTRRLRLTEEGKVFLEGVLAAFEHWEEACAAVDARRDQPRGRLRVTAPSNLSTSVVAPVLGRLTREHENLSVELSVDDRPVDLVAGGFDVGVRMGFFNDSSLICRTLGHQTEIIVAAPDFDAGDEPDGLGRLPWVANAQIPWEQITVRSTEGETTVVVTYRASASNAEGQMALVEQGAGLAIVPTIIAAGRIDSGSIVRVFPQLEGRNIPIIAVYPERRHMPSRVSLFLEALKARIEEFG